MKLIKARVQNFRSVEDSETFEIGHLTCLVGKNEAGKTALLSALRGLNPEDTFTFDKIRDYPRRFLNRFDERHPDGTAEIIRTWWQLDQADKDLVTDKFGANVLTSDTVEVSNGIGMGKTWLVPFDNEKCLDNAFSAHSLPAPERNSIKHAKDAETAVQSLSRLSERTQKQQELLAQLQSLTGGSFIREAIEILGRNLPKFFYTSHFERMSGEISLDQLQKDKQQNKISPGDKIFLDFLAYAGTSLEELQSAQKHEDLMAKCEGAGNDITEEIFQFWSQNSALSVKIELSSGKPGDLPPFNTGTISKIRIFNDNHKASLPLSERSAGFVWFFSFLAQFKQLKKSAGNAIILLDEPGLTLHGKAQGDLLRYIEERILPEHQVIFTTHSPFMVPSDRFDDVRVVEDVIEYGKNGRNTVHGTKVRSDVLRVDDDTIFPLQGALGYEITQTLFVGAHTLLVEGPSDIIYLQVLSEQLRRRKRIGLDRRWTICPSGGIDKIAPFVRLFAGANKLHVAVLSDLADGDKGKIEKLKRTDILKAGHVHTVADFLSRAEADVEDILEKSVFLRMLNEAFELDTANALDWGKLDAAAPNTTRIIKKAEAAFRVMPDGVKEFDHFTPAEWLLRNPAILDGGSAEVETTLANAEKIFKAINELLPIDG